MREISIKDTAVEMVESLKSQAIKHEVDFKDIIDLFEEQDVNSLDDVFGDGGEVRCEHFTDLAWDYALQFGEFAGKEFEEARWEATEMAMELFKHFVK